MASPQNPPSTLRNRSSEYFKHDREEVNQTVHDTKRRRVEVDIDGSNCETIDGVETRCLPGNSFTAFARSDAFGSLNEDNPEQLPLEKLHRLYGEHDPLFPSTVETEPGNPDYEAIDEDMQHVAEWTYGEGRTRQDPVQAGQGTTQYPERSGVKKTIQPVSSSVEQTRPQDVPEATSLPAQQSVKTLSCGLQNPPKRVFPPADTPIRDDIPLAELCEKWPNHLNGLHLRRFIQADWTAGKIFVSMHSDARDTLTKVASLPMMKGWEIIQQRLDDEKKKMAGKELAKSRKATTPETPASIGQQFSSPSGTQQKSTSTKAPMNGSNYARPRAAMVPSTYMSTVLNFQQPVQANASSQPRASTSTTSPEDHKVQCRKELEKHDRLLNLLFSGPPWDQKPLVENQQRIRDEWATKARKCERKIIDRFRVNVSGIDFQSSNKGDMLVRQGE